ncbi:MAG: antibiotic biosynthesis monooxygenase [Saprospiraceae bacterium]|nr:antibiotic biosynthesis monooxygenase [Saprospiraceae bacterium]
MESNAGYYAVIFTSVLSEDTVGYQEMSQRMLELAMQQEGYLGHETARSEIGITISYWKSLEAIKIWKQNEEHLFACIFNLRYPFEFCFDRSQRILN